MLFTTIVPAGHRRHLCGAGPRRMSTLAEPTPASRSQSAPTIEQDEQSFTLSFDVPGATREQLVVGIEGNVVRLSSAEGAPRQYRFAAELPQDIDAGQSQAKLENGVLTLKLAKVAPASRITKLEIQ